MSTFVTIHTYPTLFEAQIVRGLLESNGIEAHVLSPHAGGLGAPNVLGGIALQVFEQDLEKAKSILDERDSLLKG